jgi:hypothetical protein
MSDLTGSNLPQAQPAKVAPFAGENEADVRKMAAGLGAPAIFLMD